MYSNLYLSDIGVLRKYTDTNYKLSHLSICRQKGFELDDDKIFTAKGEAGNDGKLDTSLYRTKRMILELAICNPWDLFCTFTLDKTKYDRTNLAKFNKDFSQFLRDYRKKHNLQVRYLLIPEQHKDGCWHMHGFLSGLPLEHLKEFFITDKLPIKILSRLKSGKRVFTWEAYAKKFGFSDIELIENHEASSRYITKYVTKDAFNNSRELNTHLFYASKGLKRAEIAYQDFLVKSIYNPDFQNEHVTIKNFNNVSDPMRYFLADENI